MTIKVVHIVEDFNVGGLEKQVMLMMENINKSIFSMELWCLDEGGVFEKELSAKGHRVKILGIGNYHNIFNILKLAKLFRSEKVDIIHSHEYFSNTMSRLAAILSRKKIVFAHIQNSHWTKSEMKWRNYFISFLLSFFSTKIIACSKKAAEFQTQKSFIPKSKIALIYNCANLNELKTEKDMIKSRKKEFGIKNDLIIILSAARLTHVKGHKYLLEALATIIKQRKDIILLIAGEGAERNNLEKLIEEKSLKPYVRLLGLRRDIHVLLGLSNIFVQPTVVREGLPLAILEAMACKLPVLATNVGGVSEAVTDEETGFLVPKANSAELANKLLLLINNASVRKKMGTNGFLAFQKTFSVQIMISKLEKLYLSAYGSGSTN